MPKSFQPMFSICINLGFVEYIGTHFGLTDAFLKMGRNVAVYRFTAPLSDPFVEAIEAHDNCEPFKTWELSQCSISCLNRFSLCQQFWSAGTRIFSEFIIRNLLLRYQKIHIKLMTKDERCIFRNFNETGLITQQHVFPILPGNLIMHFSDIISGFWFFPHFPAYFEKSREHSSKKIPTFHHKLVFRD